MAPGPCRPGHVLAILLVAVAAGGCLDPKAKVRDEGDFEFSIQFRDSFVADDRNQSLLGAQMYPAASDYLNERLRLPQSIPVLYVECQNANAYWNSTRQLIEVCHQLGSFLLPQLLSHLAGARQGEYSSQEELEEMALNVTLDALQFIFFHEAGHALIDLYELPVTGREEDVADQFATWILLRDGRRSVNAIHNTTVGEESALGGAAGFTAFARSAFVSSGGNIDWAEAHSFNLARAFNVVCWVYGSDPARLAWLTEQTDQPERLSLPPQREYTCNYEWERIDYAFSALLARHLK